MRKCIWSHQAHSSRLGGYGLGRTTSHPLLLPEPGRTFLDRGAAAYHILGVAGGADGPGEGHSRARGMSMADGQETQGQDPGTRQRQPPAAQTMGTQARDGRGDGAAATWADLTALCPQAPHWQLDWNAINTALPLIGELQGCPQDPVWHNEGDAWTHTCMVLEDLVRMPAWRELERSHQLTLFAAALLHDVAKPGCLQRDAAGRVSTRGHPARGEVMARTLLWRLGAPRLLREEVAALVLHHQLPFFLHRRPDRQRLAIRASWMLRCDRLALLAEADARGHICAGQRELSDGVAGFIAYCRELGCFDRPRPFASNHARFLYFQGDNGDPEADPPCRHRCGIVLMSGLPGAGKATWMREQLAGWPVCVQEDPLLPRDTNHAQHAVGVGGAAGGDRSLDMPRGYLREGLHFVWYGTNLGRAQRARALAEAAAAGAHVRIVHLEAPESELLERNRRKLRPVPGLDLQRLLDLWEMPHLTEAHCVDWLPGE